MPQMAMLHNEDPADAIWRSIGDLSGVEVPYSQVLLGIYKRPPKTVSGIHLPDQVLDEDRYQGKACLVLKVGPMAFVDTDDVKFGNFKVCVGEWIVIRPSDGWAVSIHGADCRIVNDVAIRLVVKSPDIVW
jgi:co-chaperonin GroES (HSP10)